jgi:3',5'-cyclic AMP phosphodiesterase CpdA
MNYHRRSFLACAAGGTAALVWSRRLPAAEALPEFSFVIVSDTHLGRQESKAPERQWRQAIDEINASPGDFVLHLGDVVDSGRPEQYPLYAQTRRTLKKPIHEVPGNHDPVELFAKHVAAPIDRSFDHAGVRFVLFNNSHTDSHLGFITPEQIAWFAGECDAAAAKNLKIVVGCHVPIHTNAHPDRGWHVKSEDGQRAFYEVLDRHLDRVLAIFHGHFHNGIRGWRDHGRVVETLCPSVCYNQSRKLEEALKAGKTTGFFVEELRPGYVLATLGKGRLTLRYKPLGADVNGEYAAEWS